MQRRFINLVVTIGIIPLILSCQNTDLSQTINSQEYDIFAKKAKDQIENQWFEKLSPELKEYYADAKGKTGEDLFKALHKIISLNNKMESYTSSRAFLFSQVENFTKSRNQTGVMDGYSQIFIPGSGEFGEGYRELGDANKDGVFEDKINAEHTWPQSFYGKSLPMVSDLHALQTVLSMPNIMRSDFPFGEVKKDITYTTICGSRLSVLNNRGQVVKYSDAKNYLEMKQQAVEQNKDEVPNTEYRGVFEPCKDQKGNTARSMLYFYLRYFDMYIRQGSYNSDTFWKSKVVMFINWSEKIDPIDNREKTRNEIIYKKQGNRNPFIDIPELASLIGERPFLRY